MPLTRRRARAKRDRRVVLHVEEVRAQARVASAAVGIDGGDVDGAADVQARVIGFDLTSERREAPADSGKAEVADAERDGRARALDAPQSVFDEARGRCAHAPRIGEDRWTPDPQLPADSGSGRTSYGL
jgi:hypothetical protein